MFINLVCFEDEIFGTSQIIAFESEEEAKVYTSRFDSSYCSVYKVPVVPSSPYRKDKEEVK